MGEIRAATAGAAGHRSASAGMPKRSRIVLLYCVGVSARIEAVGGLTGESPPDGSAGIVCGPWPSSGVDSPQANKRAANKSDTLPNAKQRLVSHDVRLVSMP